MNKKKVFICGATGFLGEHLIGHLSEKYDLILQGYKKKSSVNINFVKIKDVFMILNKYKPDIIVNLICFSDVEQCEKNIEMAYDLNTRVVKNIASWVLKSNKKTRLVQISTDHVYNKITLSPENKVNLVNNYAITKYLGEQEALKAKGIVLRTNFFASPKKIKRGVISWLLDAHTKKQKIQLVSDIFFNPVHISTLCKVIEKCFSKKYSGIVNVGSKNFMSKKEFIIKTMKHLGLKINRYESIDYKNLKNYKCARPRYMLMNLDKLKMILRFKVPNLKDEIKKIKNEN